MRAVNRLTFSANFKEILFLLGPNGAGKTTLIKMICGLLKPDSGSVNIMDLGNQTLHSFQCTHIGYCPQHLSIWQDLTCHEQLVFMAEMYGLPSVKRKKMIGALLDNLCLSGKEYELAEKLSGGMQRCLNLALAMVHDPKILILDEPFAGLDIQSRFHLRKMICSFAYTQGKAVIISTHNIDEAERIADRVAIMDHGALLKIDTPSALKSKGKASSIIEISLQEATDQLINKAVGMISKITTDVIRLHDTLIINTDKNDELIGQIHQVLNKQAFRPLEVRIRERSLEDLFVELTGRRLNA
ncbi:MAG: ABC transporter ATP-binding protein [Deltaproteobacteria bacterium]|nr:ABC transporter ATP-binding protein [Deltaproteobacteria bacterium]